MVRKFMLSALLAVVLVQCAFGQGNANGFKGFWNGVLSAGGQNINVEFEILEQQVGVVGKMNVQGIKGIPVEVAVAGDTIGLTVKQLGMDYSGVLASSVVKGTFQQHGVVAELLLYPGRLTVNRPQTPVAPYPYITEEVSFENVAEGATLTGTISYPVGYSDKQAGSVPVVVMVTGSGTQNRDEEIYDHKPFAVIADWLARNGIASLRYDDRGAGGSSKPVEGATSLNNAGDAKAAVGYVRGLGKFGKVGVLGHSEGGTIAFMLAGDRIPDFIVSLAGVATSGLDCIVWQNKAQMELMGVPQQIMDDYGKVLTAIYTERIKGGAIAQGDEFVQRICTSGGLVLPASLVANAITVATMRNEWIDWFVGYNPADAIGKIVCPVMALNGSLDMQVPAEANLGMLGKLLPANEKHMIKEYPELNHLFQRCTKETSLKYDDIEETISPQVLDDIVAWIGSLGR